MPKKCKVKGNRRDFLKNSLAAAVGAIGFPQLIPSSALGRTGTVAPNDRITLGFIGVGKQGTGLLYAFLNTPGTQVLAVSDVDNLKLNRAKEITQNHYAGQSIKMECAAYHDFRELLARDDIDAVVIATPDHWHEIPVIEAAQAGKDIYCEKPLSLTIAEARSMVWAVRRYGRVFQTGSMQRSMSGFRFACELVRNGYIGELKTVTVNIGGPSEECYLPAEPVPDYLDWDRWLGPAPWRPFHSELAPHISIDIYPNWRNYRDYSGGGMTDWGAHHFDIAQWGLGMDESGPVEIIPPDGKDYKVLTYKYANGVTMTRDEANGTLFTGTEGKVEVNRGYLKTWPDSLMRQVIGPHEIHLYESDNHYTDWLQAIRTRNKPICDVETGCRSVTVCHLGNLAYQLGLPLHWDPVREQFTNCEEGNRLLARSRRSPWNIG